MATAADVHELEHHGGGIRVEFNKVDGLLGQAEAVDAHQILGLTQTFGPNLHLPHLFKRGSGVWHAIVSQSSALGGVLTCRETRIKGNSGILCRSVYGEELTQQSTETTLKHQQTSGGAPLFTSERVVNTFTV